MRRRTCLAAAVMAVLVGGAMAPAVDVVASRDAKVYVEPIAGMPNRLVLGNKGGDQDENFVGNKGGTDSVGYYAAFLLPTLAVGETFSSASIKITLHGSNLYPDLPNPALPEPSNASLKFMGIFDALGNDWQQVNGPARILLQDDFSTPAIGRKNGGTGTGGGGWDYVTRDSSVTGNAALVAAMNSATPTKLDGTAPASPDRYLYVMLAYDPAAPADSRANYQIASLASSAGGGAGPEFDPTFTYETVGVPEPSMLALAGIGSLGLLRRRRR